ncbi:MAG: putative toxin-antitoxin system toxin component, PIN family [Prevotella sp.]|nr:putative toxin-antitoxin system toxin component, PIN family [Prevotella sp.]MBR6016428.1 putative toxin-antitoxin system toxin component, PIN family [Prevotella sp.]
MKIVLDTNCLIQSLPKQSRYHAVWQSFVEGKNKLCVTNEIIDEYLEILQRLFDFEMAELTVKTILNSPFVQKVTPYYNFPLIAADPDDNKFVDCAISAGARYLVTNDRHFDVLKKTPFPHVEVIALRDFHQLLGGQAINTNTNKNEN